MRHGKKIKKLGKSASHRRAMFANMAASLIQHKRIKTTEAKAKEARRVIERLITYGKNDTTHSRRLAFAILRQKDVVKALFEEIAPVYKTRAGGYTRIYKLGRRPNDAAKVVLLELVDFLGTEKTAKKKAAPEKTKAKAAAAEVVTETAEKETAASEDKPAKATKAKSKAKPKTTKAAAKPEAAAEEEAAAPAEEPVKVEETVSETSETPVDDSETAVEPEDKKED